MWKAFLDVDLDVFTSLLLRQHVHTSTQWLVPMHGISQTHQMQICAVYAQSLHKCGLSENRETEKYFRAACHIHIL